MFLNIFIVFHTIQKTSRLNSSDEHPSFLLFLVPLHFPLLYGCQGPLNLDQTQHLSNLLIFQLSCKIKIIDSSPRIGQAGRGSQKKERTSNHNVKFINWIQDQCMNPNQPLILGSGWLLLLPYAQQALGFEEWQWELLQRLYTNHHLSLDFPLTNHVFMSGVAALVVQEHNMSTSC